MKFSSFHELESEEEVLGIPEPVDAFIRNDRAAQALTRRAERIQDARSQGTLSADTVE
ncbi:MAG: hypothetical protein ABFC80_09330 [Coriobacteriales bacterium]|nr:hypothetical protein [Nocardiaceae bacterium]